MGVQSPVDESTEHRVSVRVPKDMRDELGRIADRRFEGRWSMVAREAFRLLIASEQGGERSDVGREGAR